jgi:hypothetical protein
LVCWAAAASPERHGAAIRLLGAGEYGAERPGVTAATLT